MTSILPQYKMISSFANKIIQLKKKLISFPTGIYKILEKWKWVGSEKEYEQTLKDILMVVRYLKKWSAGLSHQESQVKIIK